VNQEPKSSKHYLFPVVKTNGPSWKRRKNKSRDHSEIDGLHNRQGQLI
jgi:hypothetical protein